MKKKNLLILILLLILVPFKINASSDYQIDNNDINIEVTEDKIEYTETVEVTFNHLNEVFSKNITSEMNDIKSNHSYYIEDNKILNIKSTKINETYKFTYNYDFDNKDKYEITIDNPYNSDIDTLNFTLSLDEQIYKSNITVYLNDKKLSTKDISLKIDDNKVYGEYSNTLSSDDKIIIKIDKSKVIWSKTTIISMIIPLVFALISYLIWHIYGKDVKIKYRKTSNYPKKYNPLELSILYKEQATKEDCFNLLIYLANKGYLTIKENTKKEITIEKNKEYDGKNYIESSFLKSLFRQNKTVTMAEYINALEEKKINSRSQYLKEIPKKEVYSKFNKASNLSLSLINRPEEKNKYYEKKPENIKNILLLQVIIILITITSIPFIEISKLYLLPISVVLSIVTLKIIVDALNFLNLEKITKKDIILLVVIFVAICLLISLPLFGKNRLYFISYLINCLSASFILFLYKYMPKRSIYGSKEYSKVKGFKTFIEECTLEEFQRVLEIDENYLYNIYPYLSILGIEEELIKKIKTLKIKDPSWLITTSNLTPTKFLNTLNRIKYNLTKDEEK